MGIGDKLLDRAYSPPPDELRSTLEVPYFQKAIVRCPVTFTDDIVEYVESPEFLNMKLRPLQKKFLENLFSKDENGKDIYNEGVLCGGMRGGKSVALGTKILMYDGSIKKIEDVEIGDLVMGPDSTPRKVFTKSRGISEMFKIEQSCAMDYVVNDVHILSLKKAKSVNTKASKKLKKNAYVRYGEYSDTVNIPIKDYLEKPRKWKYFFRGYKAGFISFDKKSVPLDPYFLGVWLGDGTTTQPEITSNDKEIIDWLTVFSKENNLRVSINNKQHTEAKTLRLCKARTVKTMHNPLFTEMQKLNVIGNKHIPQIYISNSKEIRLKLLAGLLDTDGHYRANRHGYDIALANETLARDVKRLADTLGYRTHIQEKKTTCQIEGYEGKAWRVSIYGDVWEIPCLIKRKQYVHTDKKSNKEGTLSSIKVTPVGIGEYAGIGVDGDNLYCLEDGTVTHNSWTGAFVQTFMTQRMLSFDQPAKDLGQAPGTRLTGQCIASSEAQANETIYAHVESIISYSPWWRKYIDYLKERENKEGKGTLFLQLKHGMEFYEKNIAMLSLHSNSAALAGKTSYCIVLDELSRFDVGEGITQSKSEKRTADAVYSTVVRACSSLRRAGMSKVVTISSPMFEDDYTMKLIYMASKLDVGVQAPIITSLCSKVLKKVPALYGMHATSFELNPELLESDFDSERLQNPEAYRRDYYAIPPSTVNPFMEYPEKIDRIIHHRDKIVVFSDKIIEESLQTNEGLVMRHYIGKRVLPLRRDKMNKYFICVDQGEKKDHFTVAMGHVEEIPIETMSESGMAEQNIRLKVIIDFVEGWVPDKENRITVSFQNVEEAIKIICESFNVNTVAYDQWSSTESLQRLFSSGINTERIGASLEMYDVFKQLIYQGQVELPEHDILIKEMKQLTVIKSKKVEHPPDGGKDYADSVCRVVWLCYEMYIMDTIHGNFMLPLKQNLPTIRSIANAYELMKVNQNNPHAAIWDQGAGGLAPSGHGVFGETFFVKPNVMPNIRKH